MEFEWLDFDGDDCFRDFHINVVTETGTRRFNFGQCAVNGLRKFSRFFRDTTQTTVGEGFRNPGTCYYDLDRKKEGYSLVVRFEDTADLISLTIDAKLRRYGGVVHTVVPPNPATGSTSRPKPLLLKALARAHSWYEMVLNGKAFGQTVLARRADMTERYVSKVLPCAFLAPNIVESILQGRQPDDLTFARLVKGIPLSWAEQRQQFGFASVLSR
jgi:hypothetical protein